MPDFSLWLEFEAVDFGDYDIENEFCNIHVDTREGIRYGINVWTFKFIETARLLDQQNGENLSGTYLRPPDLLVKELTRECIEKTIEDLLKKGPLDQMLNPSVYAGSLNNIADDD